MKVFLLCSSLTLLAACGSGGTDSGNASNTLANNGLAEASNEVGNQAEIGSKPGCDAFQIGDKGSVFIECGGPPDPPEPTTPPDKHRPDKPDRTEPPDRSQYIAVDREMVDRYIKDILKTPIDAPAKARAIEGLQQHHRDCVSGRSKCFGEP